MKRFEYLIRINCDVDDLNKLGKEGWEVMYVVDTVVSRRFYFKKETNESIIPKKMIHENNI